MYVYWESKLGFRRDCAKMLSRDPLADPAPRQPAESGELPGFIVSVWMIQTAITSRYIKRGRQGGLQSTEEGGVLQLLTMLLLLAVVVVMTTVLVPANCGLGCTLIDTFWKCELVHAVYDVSNKDKLDSNQKI